MIENEQMLYGVSTVAEAFEKISNNIHDFPHLEQTLRQIFDLDPYEFEQDACLMDDILRNKHPEYDITMWKILHTITEGKYHFLPRNIAINLAHCKFNMAGILLSAYLAREANVEYDAANTISISDHDHEQIISLKIPQYEDGYINASINFSKNVVCMNHAIEIPLLPDAIVITALGKPLYNIIGDPSLPRWTNNGSRKIKSIRNLSWSINMPNEITLITLKARHIDMEKLCQTMIWYHSRNPR